MKGGWKTQGGGKHTVNSAKNPSPKTFLDPPPTIRFPPPPLFWRLSVISPKRKRHRPDQPQFLRPPNFKWFWRAHSAVPSPPLPPQIHAIRFAPPSAAAQYNWGHETAVDARNCGLVSTAEKFSKSFWEKTGNFLERLGGVSAPAVYKNPAVVLH